MFVQGNSYKNSGGTCYCYWYLNKAGSDDLSGVSFNKVLVDFVNVGGVNKLDYKKSPTRNYYFGANGVTTGDAAVPNQIDETKSYAGEDPSRTGKDAILRIISVYTTQSASNEWYIASTTKLLAITNATVNNMGLFTSCFR